MGGTSIAQAKASLLYALGRLKPADRFNVIRFDDTMDVLFPDTVPADAAQRRPGQGLRRRRSRRAAAPRWCRPMKAALADRRDADDDYLRQVVFLTDGEIGNEQQLFDTIAAMRGRSRVFMVGIGSAPNSFLMTRAAEIGRGTFTHIGSVDQVETRMRELFDKLEKPGRHRASPRPSRRRGRHDARRCCPISIAASRWCSPPRSARSPARSRSTACIGDRPWIVRLPLAKAADGQGLSKLWARRKIADAEVARTLRQIDAEEADRRILALALEHHLVSRLTSLVAVDTTPSRPDGARLTRADLPLNLPAGWDFDKVFGRRARAGPAPRRSDRADVAPPDRCRSAHAALPRSPRRAAPRSSPCARQAASRCRRPRPTPRSA